MRVTIEIDGYPKMISTRDPELLGRWLGEVFAGIDWNPSTLVRAQVWPESAGPDGRELDWIADSRIITRHEKVMSPLDFVDALHRQLNDLAALKAAGE